MKITVDKNISPEKGDFGEIHNDGSLHIPMEYVAVIRALGVTTTEALYDLATTDPDSLTKLFGWSSNELEKAVSDLFHGINFIKPEYFTEKLIEPYRFKRGVGSNSPEDIKSLSILLNKKPTQNEN